MPSNLELMDLRTKLNQMTERIVSRLKDRSRYALNTSVYRIDEIPIEGRTGISFFEFALEQLEQYHAALGRYRFPDQYRLTNISPHTPVQRELVPTSSIQQVDIELKDEIITYYLTLLHDLCEEGDDPTTYGETVYCDADLIVLLHERINLGRFVAESKLQSDASLQIIAKSQNALRTRLRKPQREQTVIANARKIALSYNLNQDVVEHCFRWLITKTLEVEINYLQQRFRIAS
jgi:monofunctional chorismate mutase